MLLLLLFFIKLIICIDANNSSVFRNLTDLITGIDIKINGNNIKNGELAFYSLYSLPSKTISTIEIANFTDPNIGYGIVQVHACWYNVTLVFNKTNVETGTNIGLIVYPDTNETSQILQIKNNNYYTAVNVSVAFIAYDQEAPIPGLCDSDYKTADLSVTENTEFIYVDTPTAAASELSIKLTNQSSVCNASISYIGYHFFLGRGDFSCQSYFTALRKMLTIKDIRHIGSLGISLPYQKHRRTYISVPGTGIVFATIIQSSDGNAAAYVPAYTISCTPPLWESNCSIFVSQQFRTLNNVLLFAGIIRAFGGSYCSILGSIVDGFIIGAFSAFLTLYYGFGSIEMAEHTEYVIMIVSGTVTAILMGLIFFCKPPSMYLSGSISAILISYILAAFSNYIFDANPFDIGFWFYAVIILGFILTLFSILSPGITFIVFSSSLGVFFIHFGLAFHFNLHSSYVLINAMHLAKGYQNVHITPPLTYEDFSLSIGSFFIFLLAFYVQCKFKLSENGCNRVNRRSERSPLITRWTHGSDEVFESPITNSRILSRFRRT